MIFQIWDWEVVICTYLEKQLRLFFKLNYIFLRNKYIIQDSPDDVQILHTRSKLMAFLEVMGEWQWHPEPELGYPDQRSSSRPGELHHIVLTSLCRNWWANEMHSQKYLPILRKSRGWLKSRKSISVPISSFQSVSGLDILATMPRARKCKNKLSIPFTASLKNH